MNDDTPNVQTHRTDALAIGFGLLVAAIFVGALVGSWSMVRGAALMPMAMAILGIALCLIGAVRAVVLNGKPIKEINAIDIDEVTDVPPQRAARFAAWMASYIAGLWLVGLPLATIAFAIIFLRVERKAPPLVMAIVTGITMGAALLLGQLLNIRWPNGILFS